MLFHQSGATCYRRCLGLSVLGTQDVTTHPWCTRCRVNDVGAKCKMHAAKKKACSSLLTALPKKKLNLQASDSASAYLHLLGQLSSPCPPKRWTPLGSAPTTPCATCFFMMLKEPIKYSMFRKLRKTLLKPQNAIAGFRQVQKSAFGTRVFRGCEAYAENSISFTYNLPAATTRKEVALETSMPLLAAQT